MMKKAFYFILKQDLTYEKHICVITARLTGSSHVFKHVIVYIPKALHKRNGVGLSISKLHMLYVGHLSFINYVSSTTNENNV